LGTVTGKVLSLPEAAEQLGLETEAVLELVLRRELGFTQTTTGRIQIPADALDEYIARTRTTA